MGEIRHEKGPENKEPVPEKTLHTSVGVFKAGDNVTVMRTNGQFENDWQLSSFGDKSAVVEKIDPKTKEKIRKVIPLKEFDIFQSAPILEDAKKKRGWVREIKKEK